MRGRTAQSAAIVATVLLLCPLAAAQGSRPSDSLLDANMPASWAAADGSAAASEPAGWETAATAPAARLVPWADYSGGLEDRAALTGDWKGNRQWLMNHGVRLNLNLTQTLQGNVAGGRSNQLFYQGGVRYEVELDTEAMRMWPGGKLHVRGETQYGQSDLFSSGTLLPVNTDALYPEPNQQITALSEAYYVQFLAPWLGFAGGKFSPRDRNVFAHDETTQFLNTAFNFDPAYSTTVPLDFLGAEVILIPTDWLSVRTLVLDSEGRAGTSGFDTAFESGTGVYQLFEFSIEPFERPGHQRLAWTWSDQGHVPEGLTTGLKTGSDWSILYDFDQYLYIKPGTKDQGFGLFGRFGLGDDLVNPVAQFYSLGAGGKGLIPGRQEDTFGVGYYLLAVSDEIPTPIRSQLEDEQGVEVWYNIELAPWWHLTPDIQIIDAGRTIADTPVVLGLRMRIDF